MAGKAVRAISNGAEGAKSRHIPMGHRKPVPTWWVRQQIGLDPASPRPDNAVPVVELDHEATAKPASRAGEERKPPRAAPGWPR